MSETNAFYNSLKELAIEIDTLRSEKEAHERLKYKSQCQAECLDAFDIKLTQAEAENARLKAEVERLNKELDETKVMLVRATSNHA
jgi:alanyl-tRNA synthetase